MFLVTAIIKAHRVEAVTDALKGIGISGMTVSNAQGFGRQRGHTEVYRGSEYKVDFVPKVRVDVLTDDTDVDKVMETIAESARTGKIGDGKIWITEAARSMRIRTGETGHDALGRAGRNGLGVRLERPPAHLLPHGDDGRVGECATLPVGAVDHERV